MYTKDRHYMQPYLTIFSQMGCHVKLNTDFFEFRCSKTLISTLLKLLIRYFPNFSLAFSIGPCAASPGMTLPSRPSQAAGIMAPTEPGFNAATVPNTRRTPAELTPGHCPA